MKSFILLIFPLLFITGCVSQFSKLNISHAPADIDLPNNMLSIRDKAETGDLDSMFQMGVYYAEIYDDIRDKNPHAMFWLKLAANKGHIWSQNEMGNTFRDGRFGEEVDFNKAFKWFHLAAKGDDDMAQYNLGRMYRDGLGVIRDEKKSLEFLELSAAKGYPNAIYMVSLAYKLGNGTKANNALYLKNRYLALLKGINDYEFFKCEFQFFSYDLITNAVIQGLFRNYYVKVHGRLTFEEALMEFADKFIYQETIQAVVEEFLQKDLSINPERYESQKEKINSNEFGKLIAPSLSIYTMLEKQAIQFELTRVAALMGNKTAQKRLVKYYQIGIGVEKNIEEAQYWMTR